MNKLHGGLNTILILFVAIFLIVGGNQSGILGGDTNFDSVDTTDGYKVDGTTVIDGNGNVDASITSDTGTFSSTLTVSGETNLDTLIFGGDITTLTAGIPTSTVTAAQMCNSSVIVWAPDVANASGTLPAAADITADCLTANGDSKTMFWRNTGYD